MQNSASSRNKTFVDNNGLPVLSMFLPTHSLEELVLCKYVPTICDFFLATKLQNFPFQPVLFSPSWHKPWGNTREVRNTYSARDIHHAEAIFITSYSHATSLLPLQSCQDTSTAGNSVASPQRTSLWENVLLWIFTTAFLWNDEYTWCLRTLLPLFSTV